MKWIFIGMLLNSIVTSDHDSREACEGRAVLLREKGVIGKCVEQQQQYGLTFGSQSNQNQLILNGGTK